MKDKDECSHNIKYLSKINSSDLFVFCKNCGLIIYKKSEKSYVYSIKPPSYQNKTEIDPIELYQVYVNTPFTIIEKNSPYFLIREHAVSQLEKYRHSYNFSEETFYLAMTYMDIIFKKFGEKTVRGKEFELYIMNSLLLAGKFYEKDIRELQSAVDPFWELNNYRISEKDIILNEIECLKILNYKLDHHSAYDLLKFFMYNGIVYRNDSYALPNIIYNYSLKIFRDVMNSNISLCYHPLPICFSIITLARKRFKLNTKYLKKIYSIKLNDYKDCYEEIKVYIEKLENNPYCHETPSKKTPVSTYKSHKKFDEEKNKDPHFKSLNLSDPSENTKKNINSNNITTVQNIIKEENEFQQKISSPSNEQNTKQSKNLKYVEGVDKKVNIKNFVEKRDKFSNGRKRPRTYTKYLSKIDIIFAGLFASMTKDIFVRKSMHSTTVNDNTFNYKNYISGVYNKDSKNNNNIKESNNKDNKNVQNVIIQKNDK